MSRSVVLRILLPLIFCTYFGSLLVAVWHFPEAYDWRYRVISNLLSPRDNPDFYRIPSIGLALTGLAMIPLAIHLFARLEPISRTWARSGQSLFALGALFLICAAIVVPQHVHTVLGLRRLHEALARFSAIGLGAGMLCACACAYTERRSSAGAAARRLDSRLFPLWASLTVVPIALIAISQLLLLLSHFLPACRAAILPLMRHSVFWHLGFWEWTGSAAIFLFLTTAAWLLPAEAGAEDSPST